MKDSPFIYGNTVSIQAFTNREKELKKLTDNLLQGINTTIISPRRWGKSSLVEKAMADINKKDKKTKTIIIDLFTVSSQEEFLEIFAREIIKASSSKWQEWLTSGQQFFSKLIPKLSLGIDPFTDFSIGFDKKELKKHSDEVLNLPEIIAQKKGIKFIICLDEFQNLASYEGFLNFEKKIRALWQRHKLVTYCLYGSKRHMMTDIFNNPSKPFYRFGDIMLLPKIATLKWIKFIVQSFAATGKTIQEADAQLIADTMKNHSWYVQQLAHYTWNMTSKKATKLEISNALKELIQANTPLYQKEVESISLTQLSLLKAIAKGETQFTSTRVMQENHLGTPNNVSKNKASLLQGDVIDDQQGVLEFLDPAFEMWFRKNFLHQSFELLR